ALIDPHAPPSRAAKALEGATSVGVNQLTFGERLQSLATEVLVSNARAVGDDEEKMIPAYGQPLKPYGGSWGIWKAPNGDSSEYKWADGAVILELHSDIREIAPRRK